MNVTFDAASVRFAKANALDQVSLSWGTHRIHGLLGRNGAGKSTLLSLIAAARRPSSGTVRVNGQDPWERSWITEQVCLIRESGDLIEDGPIENTVGMLEELRPTFDAGYAADLLNVFGLDEKQQVATLSRGQKSALGATIGLATRAPVTLLDEVHLGMDAPTRQRFYDELIADFAQNPRTYVISSHLIAELEPIIETVTVLGKGKVLMQAESDDVRAQGLTLTGPAAIVTELVEGLPVIGSRDLGPTRQVTVFGQLDHDMEERVRAAGVDVGAVPLQDLFIHLTEENSR